MATRGRKWLIGCGGGCLGLIVLSIGACVGFSVWVTKPGELLQPARLLGSDTTGYVEWSLDVEDPGTEAFVEGLMDLQERAQARNPRRGPDWLNQVLRNRQQQNRSQTVHQLLPAVVAWTLSPGEKDTSDLHLFTVSIRSMGNRMRFLDVVLRYSVGLKHSTQHADERIYADDNAGAMFIRDGSFFVTSSMTNARLAVDRLRGEAWEMNRDPTALELRIGALSDKRPLRGAIGNPRGELLRIWNSLATLDPDVVPDEEIWKQVSGATLSGGFTGQTAFDATMDFQGPDAEWARGNKDRLLTLLRSGLGQGHLPIQLEAEAVGDRVRISLRVDDVFAFLDEL